MQSNSEGRAPHVPQLARHQPAGDRLFLGQSRNGFLDLGESILRHEVRMWRDHTLGKIDVLTGIILSGEGFAHYKHLSQLDSVYGARQLLERALFRRLVRPPSHEPRAMTEAIAGDVIITHFNNERGA